MAIERLPEKTISQIAAGEVVERPAHLVKELIENSIDAGATRLDVDLDQGGRFVQVVDNGHGISAQDLPLAFARHATSKLKDIDDLWSLSSFGFRGEALASLASVSRVQVVSHVEGADSAYRLDVDFGDFHEVAASSGALGTRITVQDLFENLPARKKFLKSETAEVSQIRNVLKAAALMHPSVSFKVRHKGELIHHWPAAESAQARVQEVLGVKPLYEAVGERDGFKVRAYFSSPKDVMRQNRNLWIFAQGRWILDRSLQAAVLDAYHSLLMHGEFPYCVIDLRCPPDEIDVNVHPTKSQVKFRNPSGAFRAVRSVLRAELEKAPWVPHHVPKPQPVTYSSTNPESKPLYFKEPEFYRTQYQQKAWVPVEGERLVPSLEALSEPRESADVEDPCAPAGGFWSSLQILGQCNLTYILAQNDMGLILVDQHAAHERVNYEKLWKSYRDKSAPSQQLLVPLVLDLTAERAEALWEAKEELAAMGVELEWSGPETLCVHSKPLMIKEPALVDALMTFASEMAEKSGSLSVEKLMAHAMATMACHSSVRAGQPLSPEQMKKLLVEMDLFPLSSFCPHGRPVNVEYSFHELEKDFGRIV